MTIKEKLRSKTTHRHNRKYMKSEFGILKSILKRSMHQRGRITVRQVAKDIKSSRQTFYNHHQNINQAIIDSEKTLIKEFSAYLSEKTHVNNKHEKDINRKLISACFIFMSQRKDIFYQLAINPANQGVLYDLMRVLYPKLEVSWLPITASPPDINSERVDSYFRLAIGIICSWGKNEQCDFKKSSRYINQFVDLTADISRITKFEAGA